MTFKTLQNDFHALVQKIDGIFVSDSAQLTEFFKPFLTQIVTEGKTVLVDAATAAVTVGEATPGTGEAKMLAALAAFSATCVKEGLPYIESEARTLIEVALQNLKATLTPAAPVAA